MAKGKTKNAKAARKNAYKTPKGSNLCGRDDVGEPADSEGEEGAAAPRSRYGYTKKVKDSYSSKVKQLDRLQRVRLERSVARGRDALRNYVPPPPEETAEERKRRRRGGPETWLLRGAARPWEAVEAAKTFNPHAANCGFDAFERHGADLAAVVPAAADWVQSLVDLARDEASRERPTAALERCFEALKSDARDASGASFCALETALHFAAGLDDVDAALAGAARAVPLWARVCAFVLQRKDGEGAVAAVAAAAAANAGAARCAASYRAFDAAVECEDDLMALDDLPPGSILEALVVNAHLGLLLRDRPDDRAALAALVAKAGAADAPLPPPDVADAAPPNFPHAPMFRTMFATALDMAADGGGAEPEPAGAPPSGAA